MVEAEVFGAPPQRFGLGPAELGEEQDADTHASTLGTARHAASRSRNPEFEPTTLGCEAAAMATVLVHGVPETPEVWNAPRSELQRTDVVTAQLPGFGCPRPQGFGATKDDYVAWLVHELESIAADGPIDLLGHDWGGGFVVRVVSTRPDLVRSWVTDAAALGDVDFEWHDFAKIWQTPGEGEKFFEEQMRHAGRGARRHLRVVRRSPRPRRGPGEVERRRHGPVHPRPLPLRGRRRTRVGPGRSPTSPNQGWCSSRPRTPSCHAEGAERGRRKAGATVSVLEGIGHWWMLQDPAGAARVLDSFWSSD